MHSSLPSYLASITSSYWNSIKVTNHLHVAKYNTMGSFLSFHISSHSFSVFYDGSSSYTKCENTQEISPWISAILSDVAFLGDCVHFLSLMVFILCTGYWGSEKLSTCPKSYKWIIIAEHTSIFLQSLCLIVSLIQSRSGLSIRAWDLESYSSYSNQISSIN